MSKQPDHSAFHEGTVGWLICALLVEAGKAARARQLSHELADNQIAHKAIGADASPGPIQYVEGINHETGFISLLCEDRHERD